VVGEGNAQRTWAFLAQVLTLAGSSLAGVFIGLTAAAAGLILAGRSLLEMEPERIQMVLVLGPLFGLLPMSLLAYCSSRYLDVARRAPGAFAVWLVSCIVTTVWFGVLPLVSQRP